MTRSTFRRRRQRQQQSHSSDTSSGTDHEAGLVLEENKQVVVESDLIVPFYKTEYELVLQHSFQLKTVISAPFVFHVRRFSTGLPLLYVGRFNQTDSNTFEQYIMMLKGLIEQELGSCKFHDFDQPDFSLFVVTQNEEDKYLFLDMVGTFVCLRIGSDTTAQNVASLLKAWPGLDSGMFECFTSGRLIQVSDICELPNLSTVTINKDTPVTWVCHYQCTPGIEHRIIVNGLSSDSLHDMTHRFLQAGGSGLVMQNVSSSKICFEYRNEVLTDDILIEMKHASQFRFTFSYPHVPKLGTHRAKPGQITVNIGLHNRSEGISKTVYVHIKPTGAVTKCISVKKAPEHFRGSSMIVVISPDVTHEQLRLDVASVLQWMPGALQIRVGKKELQDVRDLQEELYSPKSNISIRIRSGILLAFKICYQSNHVVDRKVLQFYPFNTVLEVKSEVSALMHVPKYKIDLTYQGQILTEEQSIHSCGIQTETEIDVTVCESRVLLKLHCYGSSQSHVDVLVDDIESSTVKDLKQFTKTVESDYSSLLDTEILAMFDNQALRDADTLLEAGVRPDMEPREILMRRCDSLCFSANSTAEDGTFFTFQGDEHGKFTHLLTMTNGRFLFPVNMEVTEEDRQKLLSERKVVGNIQSFKGIKLMPRVLSDAHAVGRKCPHTSFNQPAVQGQRPRGESAHPVTIRKVQCQTSPRKIPQRLEAAPRQKCTGSIGEKRIHLQATSSGRGSLRAPPGSGEFTRHSGTAPGSHVEVSCPSQAADSENDVSQTAPDISDSKALQTVPRPHEPQPSTSRKRSMEVGDSGGSPEAVSKWSKTQPNRPGKQKMYRKYTTETSLEESESEKGRYELITDTHVYTRIVLDEKEKTRAQKVLITPDALTQPPSALAVEPYHAARAALQITPEEEAMWSNAKFKYIDKKIILAVAKELGESGTAVIVELGVSYENLHELQLKHGMCSPNCHLECLILWCKQGGEEANAETLKRILADNKRTDLVDLVDKLLSGKTGYTTS